jgi:hypothetical protein
VRTAYVEPGAAALPTSPGPAGWRRGPDRDGVWTYENPAALPRAWRAVTASSLTPAEVDRRIATDPAFDPAREALLEAGPAPTGLTPGPATLVPLSPNRLRLETNGPGPGLVLVNERYDAGWQAFVGTRALPVLRADALVLGVAVPAGHQVVELRYRPPGWDAMVAVSLGSLLLCGLWLILARRYRPAAPA